VTPSDAIAEERIRAAIPLRELERRWSAVRQAMKVAGIGALILQNDNQYLGGYVRYFIDVPAEQAYPMSVLFPQDDEMTVISHGGAPPSLPGPPEWAVRGVKERISRAYIRTIQFTNTWDAEEAVRVLKERKDKRLGVVGLGMMGAAFYVYLKENLPGVEIVEATDLVDRIRAVKSEDELAFVRSAIEVQDAVLAAVPTIVRPGKYEYQLRSEIARILTDLGSEEQLIMLSSAPPGMRAANIPSFYQNRQIRRGDQVLIMIEPNGPGGFYGEIARIWCLGEPPEELLRLWQISLEAQKLAAGLARPGASPGDILKSVNEFLVANGQAPENRIFAHGQGYDLVERPAFLPEEDMLLQANMVVSIHPVAASPTAFAFCCDDFLVTRRGGERLHQTPQQVFVIAC
jgi:Xaa-Pro aminopeptidase